MDSQNGEQGRERVVARLLEDEMRESFIDYSMSVIVQRALPDVRDGLKPVHRRILYAMSELGLSPGRAYKKSATVVGEVLGKYHPHGDSAVYDSMVRMVQEFSLRFPLVDGQGNFGSIDGDRAAAYRYTEARLTRLAMEMLEDIGKDTVDFIPNFDGRLEEPTVLPARVPNLLINGSSGIAVGMATNIPPHNLGEVTQAIVELIRNPQLSDDALEAIVKGPDFPTGGYICGREGIRDAYRTGRGRVVMRAKASFEETETGGERIIISEIPFMVNKARTIEQIAQLVRDKKITDIRDLRDESDRDGMRVVVELKRDAIPQVVLNQLYKHTQMQSTFGTIMLALVDGEPKVMSLRQMLLHFIDHRHEVVVRRSEYDLAQAKAREHILEGLKIAVDNIDEVIKVIRGSRDSEMASVRLQDQFGLTELQAKAILDMRLARLTGLEMEKLESELLEIREKIAGLEHILGSREVRMEIVVDELTTVAEKYGNPRRTEILDMDSTNFSIEDLIPDEEMVITLTHQGYVKRVPIDTYRAQRRGGRGLQGMGTKDEDWLEGLWLASTHDYLMIFTRMGQCQWIKVWEVPQGGRHSKGKPIVNLRELNPGDDIAAVVPIREFADDQYLMFATKRGVVKKTALSAYSNVRSVGLNAINIREGDELIEVQITREDDEVILATRDGKAIRFKESDARSIGRATEGVRGIALKGEDYVVGMVVPSRDNTRLLVVTEGGMGKRTEFDAYRLQGRGGQGVINIKTNAKTGKVVAVKSVSDEDELVLITKKGVVNRQPMNQIRVIGRATQGVRLISLDSRDVVVDVARILPEDPEAEEVDGETMDGAGPEGDTMAIENEAMVSEGTEETAEDSSDEHSDDEI